MSTPLSSTPTTSITAEPGSHALDITREFAAPAELVFRAWTEPDLVRQWLGPRRLRMTIDRWEIRDGGRYRFVHADDDGRYAFRGVFHGEPSVADGILWTFEFEGAAGTVALERITFAEVDGRTRLHVHSVYPSVEARDAMISAGMETGVREGYEQLDDLLASLAAS